MQRLSPQSMLNAVGGTGSTDTFLTPQRGLTQSDGQTSLTQMREKLLSQSPAETDRNLVQWLKSCLMVEPREEVSLTYPATGGYKRNVTGYSFKGLTDDNRSDAERAIRGAMTPATPEQCEEWVVTLHAMTARRNDDELSQAVILKFYGQALGRYPADVAQATWDYFLRRKDKPNFFPTLSELEDHCDKLARPRKMMMENVR